MGNKYTGNKTLKKKYLKSWLYKNPEYLRKKRLSNILKVSGGILTVVIALNFIVGSSFSSVGFVTGIGAGAIIGFIPYCIGVSVEIKAMYEYGAPFSREEKAPICDFASDHVFLTL